MNDVVIVTFGELTEARAASSELERLAGEDHITVSAGALVVRDSDGRFRIPEGDRSGATDESSDKALRELLRTLVGPVGLLSRLASVASAGCLAEGHDAEEREGVLCSVARRVPPGTAALVADIDAPVPRMLDTALEASGGSVTRRLRVDIEAELAATRKVLNDRAPEATQHGC